MPRVPLRLLISIIEFHFVSFQKNLLQKAASAVFTYLVSNPDNKAMQENLKFYSELPEVDMSQMVNFEARVRQLFQYFCYALMVAISNILFIVKSNLNYTECISYQDVRLCLNI
jgi:hypothetical protein